MATYEITAPDGQVFEVTAPDAATQEQVLAYAKSNFPGSQPQEEKKISQWRDLPGNIPASAGKLLTNMAQPILHPIDTARSLDNLVMGVGQKLIPGEQPQEVYADALGSAIKERYGSLGAIKETAITDPVGMLADVSGATTGGAGLLRGGAKTLASVAPKAQGLSAAINKAGVVGGKVGRMIDPTNMVVQAPGAIMRNVVEPVASHSFGQITGGGGQALRELARAGAQGGDAFADAQSHLRGVAPIQEVAEDAKRATVAMRKARGAEYQAGKEALPLNSPVDVGSIDRVIGDVKKTGMFKGFVKNKPAAEVWEQINTTVDDWKNLDPNEYHTVEGLDALKQSIGEIRDNAKYGTPGRRVADSVYHAIKGQIVKQAPEYAKVMKGYEDASKIIKDIESTLSSNPGANVDTTVRKLQSVMRNNANTTYGRRVDLAQMLEDAGAKNLMAKLAGQSYSSATPRGLQGLGASLGGVAALATNPVSVLGLGLTSPRLVGETAMYGGRAAGALNKIIGPALGLLPSHVVGQSLLQAGRNKNLLGR
ncbi:MAG: hypothetical protein WC047_00505 [Kiritimatiellales bacterium]